MTMVQSSGKLLHGAKVPQIPSLDSCVKQFNILSGCLTNDSLSPVCSVSSRHPLARKRRVESTLDLMQQAVPVFEDNVFLRRSLVELTDLYESIHRLLQLCVPAQRKQQQQQQISSTLKNAMQIARRFCFSDQNLQTLKGYTEKLDRIALHFSGPMQLVANKQANRMEETMLAMQITLDERSDPSLKLAKRWLKGNVIDSELVELNESLGRGSFGVVMAGMYYGQPVAIKRALNSVMSAEDRESFR